MKLMKSHFLCCTDMLREDHMHKDLLDGHVADFRCCSDEAYFRGKKKQAQKKCIRKRCSVAELILVDGWWSSNRGGLGGNQVSDTNVNTEMVT